MKSQKAFTFGAALILAPHLICCVLPLALAAMSLIAPVSGSSHVEIIPREYMPLLFLFSGLMLAGGYYFTFFKCPCDGSAGHRRQKIALYIVTALFIASIVMYFASHSNCSH